MILRHFNNTFFKNGVINGILDVVGGGEEEAIQGAKCIKYVEGSSRNYMGKSDRNILLKIVILPPISVKEAVQELSECDDL